MSSNETNTDKAIQTERDAIVRFLRKEVKALLRSDSIYDGWAADNVADLATRIEEGEHNEEE